MKVWWSDSDYPNIKTNRNARMELEIQAMKDLLPKGQNKRIDTQVRWDTTFLVYTHELKLNVDDPFQAYWYAIIELRRDPTADRQLRWHKNGPFAVKVQYSPNYPHDEPLAYPFTREGSGRWQMLNLSMDEHQFFDGRLCLWEHGSSSANGWHPQKSTAATFMAWSLEWFRGYCYWRTNSEFPRTG